MNFLLELALKLRRLYWRIVRPQTLGARAVLLNKQGQVLLVKHRYGKGWFLPGGRVRKNESTEKGLERELREELGITSLIVERVLGTYFNLQEFKKDTITVYVIRDFEWVEKAHFEIERTAFFPPDNLPDGISPGPSRRIQEYLDLKPITTTW